MFPLEDDSYGQITIKTKKEYYADVEYTFEFGGITNPRNTEKTDVFVINSFDSDKIN